MKRLLELGLICGCMCLCNSVGAVTLQEANGTTSQDNQSAIHYASTTQQYLNDIGVRLLNANRIDKHIVFGLNNSTTYISFVQGKDDVTSSNRNLFQTRKVLVDRDLLNNATCDDEVAALMAHEIAHCLKSYTGVLRGSMHPIVYFFTSKKQNYEADITAVDFMVKAGYNPDEMLTILDKTAGQYRFDIGENALATKRIRNVYQHIQSKYPQYLSSYVSNPYFQNAMKIIKPAEADRNWKYYTNKVKSSKKK